MDLPVWQALYEELQNQNFVPITVAFDSGGAEHARPWIEKANPTYPSLIDEHHVVAELYNMLNVPNAVWIDESGRIVRPAESAGASDAFRSLDLKTMTIPPAAQEDQRTRRQVYLDAIRDWVAKGADSVHALSPDEVRRRMAGPSDDDAVANVHFRLGLYLHAQGHAEAAQHYFDEAKRLRPESWAFKRQAWTLEQVGKAGGPEFWAAVQALGDKPYYPPVQMEGMPA